MGIINPDHYESSSDEYWMAHALIAAAQAAAIDEVPVGCVIVHNGQLIAQGYNQPISSHDPTAHAEIIAIRAAAAQLQNYRLIDCELFVTIEPCTMCCGAIVHSRFKRIVYGATEPKAGVITSQSQLLSSPWFNYEIAHKGGVLAEECALMISEFFARRRSEKKQLKQQQADS